MTGVLIRRRTSGHRHHVVMGLSEVTARSHQELEEAGKILCQSLQRERDPAGTLVLSFWCLQNCERTRWLVSLVASLLGLQMPPSPHVLTGLSLCVCLCP